MLSTNQFFDLIIHKHNLPSDRQLALRLKVSTSSISKHRNKPHGMDDALALRVAALLDYAPEYVLVCAAAERARCTEEKEVYLRLGAWLEMAYSQIPRGFPRDVENRKKPAPAAFA